MKRTLKHPRSGIAMILVIVVMATAAIMSLALLSSASMQAQAAKNATYSSSADSLDQSGTNMALYYLMYPDKAPATALKTTGSTTFYNPGTDVPAMNLADGSSLGKIAVSLTSRNGTTSDFGIDVTSTSGSNGAVLSRIMHTNAELKSRYLVKYAMASNDAFTIPASGVSVSINGDVRCDGGLGGLLSAVTGLLKIPANAAVPTYPAKGVPTMSELNCCKNLPSYGSGTAQLVSGTISSFPVANASNPDAVYYATNNLTISGNVTLVGTLIAKQNLTINGNTINITTKKTGQPALVVGGNLIFNGVLLTTRTLNVNGLCWLGGNMSGSGILSTTNFNVTGALMWGGSNPRFDNSNGLLGNASIVVNWPSSGGQTKDYPNWDYLYVPNLCDEGQTPKTLKVISN
jgi:Tfp pilus assembly protein PilV